MMLIYLLPELCLFSESHYVRPDFSSPPGAGLGLSFWCTLCVTLAQGCDKITSHESDLVFVLSIDAIPLIQEPIYGGKKERHFLLLLLLLPFLLLLKAN